MKGKIEPWPQSPGAESCTPKVSCSLVLDQDIRLLRAQLVKLTRNARRQDNGFLLCVICIAV